MDQPELSIVSTVYNSSAYLETFLHECKTALKEINCTNFEIIFVNDGSPDNSLTHLLELKKSMPQMVILDLSRNFGHHYAAVAGLRFSKGNLVFLADCDLEVSPSVLTTFHETLKAKEVDVVYGYQKVRKGNFIERFLGGIFWKTINYLSDIDIPQNILTERLMTRKYVDNLLSLGDKNLFLGGMMYWTGFNQLGTPVKKVQRAGSSTYSALKRLKLVVEAVTSFSTLPLRILFHFGFTLSLISISLGSFLLLKKLLQPESILSGYVSIVLVLIFFFGVIEMSLGILGLYLGKIFKQVQSRPLFIVKTIY